MGISALSWGVIRLSQTTSFHSLSGCGDTQSDSDLSLGPGSFNWENRLLVFTSLVLILASFMISSLVSPPAFCKCHNQDRNHATSRQKCIFVTDINNLPFSALALVRFARVSVSREKAPWPLLVDLGMDTCWEPVPITVLSWLFTW